MQWHLSRSDRTLRVLGVYVNDKTGARLLFTRPCRSCGIVWPNEDGSTNEGLEA